MTSQHPSAAEAAALIRKWYESGLRAVDPRRAVERSLAWDGHRLMVDARAVEILPEGRIVAIAIGKAASEMARGLDAVIGERISKGIILTRDGHANNAPMAWTVFEASHPVPDDRGISASRAILEEVGTLDPTDTAVVLVSGGGSALFELPRAPLGLEDIQEVTRLLLRAGAPIQHLNAVRSELSEVKGGGLRRTIGEATCVSLILSDVLGNDPTVIASGPTIVREPNPKAALDVLDRYRLRDSVPASVVTLLESNATGQPPPSAHDDVFAIVGDNDIFIEDIARQAERDGLRTTIALRLAEGEARTLATRFVDLCEKQHEDVDVVIGGGEATVTVLGDGTGGRNTEFALASAQCLHERQLDWVIASLASDGQDGSIDAAGAIADRDTVVRGRESGLDPRAYLDNNDSGGYFERVGGLVAPGPTGTNVNDVYIGIRVRA